VRARARLDISLVDMTPGTMGTSRSGVCDLARLLVNRYTYSLVFAADMYSTVFKSDPLDPGRGARYRRSILEPGGSREELDSLEVRQEEVNPVD
jgi:hypothetical protein